MGNEQEYVQQALERLGLNIKVARVQKRWTQEDLAEKSGVSRGRISDIEHGSLNLTVRNLIRVQRALDVPLSELGKGIGED